MGHFETPVERIYEDLKIVMQRSEATKHLGCGQAVDCVSAAEILRRYAPLDDIRAAVSALLDTLIEPQRVVRALAVS